MSDTNLLNELLRAVRLTSVVDVGANPIEAAPPHKAKAIPETSLQDYVTSIQLHGRGQSQTDTK